MQLLRGARGAVAASVTSGFLVKSQIDYQDLLYRSGSSNRALVSPR
jgi:hypothetical protein